MRNIRRKSTPRRFGFASVLAMLFLVLFATLAVGFCAATSLSAQVARNEQTLAISQVSAESGLQFMRYQLGIMTIPPLTPNSQFAHHRFRAAFYQPQWHPEYGDRYSRAGQ